MSETGSLYCCESSIGYTVSYLPCPLVALLVNLSHELSLIHFYSRTIMDTVSVGSFIHLLTRSTCLNLLDETIMQQQVQFSVATCHVCACFFFFSF